MADRNWLSPKLVFGLVLCFVGTLLALDNFGLINGSEYLGWWPIAIVAYGLLKAQGIGTHRAPVGGLVLAGIGTLLLLGQLDVMDFHFWDLWPFALVAIGISIVVRTMGLARKATTPGGELSDRVGGFAMMGGVTRRMATERFQGGDLSTVMGGIEVDLSNAKIAPGDHPVIETFVMWGGVDLKVPENWKVTSEAIVLLGSYEDKTRRFEGPFAGELIIRGLVLMGGIEVKS